MKKVLFATTALLATASVAAADVSFSGWGRFGIMYRDLPGAAGDSTNITSRFRLQVDASAESDGGIVFGARVRLQQNNTDNNSGAAIPAGNTGSPAGTGMNAARFFLRAGGLEVGVGNIYGAIEFMPGMYPIDLGLTGLGYEYTAYQFRADAYSSGGNGAAVRNAVEVIYSIGDLSMHLSASDGANDRIAAHFAYNIAGWTLAVGVQDSNAAADTEFAVSAGGQIGPVNLTVAYADNGTAGDHITVAGRVDVGAATNVEFYAADADNFADTSYGIDFNHDLGGGTSLRGGVASLSGGETRADFGVRFNF